MRNLEFEHVAKQELPVLYRVAQRLARNSTDAEDLVGQTLLSSARAWASFDGRHARSWMLRILKNEYLSTIRRRAARPESVSITEAELAPNDTYADACARLDASSILLALDDLPEEYRLAVSLCDLEELSYEEAALAMEVPVGTVRSRLYRGRHLLRDRLMSRIQE